MVLKRFWRSLTKKDSVKSARYNMYIKFFSTLTQVGRFFHSSGYFRIGSGFLADLDPDSEKKNSYQDPEKNRSETLVEMYSSTL